MFDLKGFRLEAELSQAELGDMLSIPQSFVSAIELGKSSMPEKKLKLLVDKFGGEVVNRYRKAEDISENDNDTLSIIREYQARLDKKDQQIESLINILEHEIKGLRSDIKKGQDVQLDNAGCADVG